MRACDCDEQLQFIRLIAGFTSYFNVALCTFTFELCRQIFKLDTGHVLSLRCLICLSALFFFFVAQLVQFLLNHVVSYNCIRKPAFMSINGFL